MRTVAWWMTLAALLALPLAGCPDDSGDDSAGASGEGEGAADEGADDESE